MAFSQLTARFHECILLTPTERESYLDNLETSDPTLAAELRALVRIHEADPDFMEESAALALRESACFDLPENDDLAGKHIGPYVITGLIGAGGMGRVYAAQDSRLRRKVALKSLPNEVAGDAAALERFRREALVLSALNHPNICTIYDIVEQAGQTFIVMEYVEGSPLRGTLPLDKVLEYGGQILEALDAAHRKHITHRDLKPTNILVNRQGIKLLDFGIAKQNDPLKETGSTESLMGEEAIAGTLNYMSPEQLQGKVVDARSDLFAFGLVLYEMLTGRRAFDGSSAASVIAGILERPAPSIAAIAPRSLDRLLERCLAKDPDDRWQSARDLRAELDWIAMDAASVHAPAGKPRAVGREQVAWISVAVAVLAALIFGVLLLGRGNRELPVTRLDVVTPPTDDPFAFALAPDGRQLVFAANSDHGSVLWRRKLDESAAQLLAGTEGASAPFWSPDSRSIGFFADGKLKRLDLDGGLPRMLASAPDGRGAAWSRDGIIVFSPATAGPLYRIPAFGGPPARVTSLEQTHHVSHRWPQSLPDGNLLFFALGSEAFQPTGIYLAPMNGLARRIIMSDTAAAYAPPGYLLVVEQGALVARRVNLNSGSVGSPVPIAEPVATDPTSWRSAFSVSDTGVLVYRATTAARRQLVWVDRAGARLESVGGIDENNQLNPSLSPDGRRIAVQRTAQGAPHTWIFDSGRDVGIRFRDNPAPEGRGVWSPDGRILIFLTALQGRQALVERTVAGGPADEKVLVLGQGMTTLDWSEDGRFLLYSVPGETTGWDIWALPLTGDGKAFLLIQTPFDEQLGQISRDGRWIAYQSNESGRTEVYIQPFLRSGERISVSTGGGIAPRWRGDGRELFYIAPNGAMMAVPLKASADGATIEAGAPMQLFRDPIVGGGSMLIGGTQQYAVAPDGQRFLINLAVTEPGSSPITIVLNWTSALKK